MTKSLTAKDWSELTSAHTHLGQMLAKHEPNWTQLEDIADHVSAMVKPPDPPMPQPPAPAPVPPTPIHGPPSPAPEPTPPTPSPSPQPAPSPPTPTPTPSGPNGPAGDWQLVWSDEFADLSQWYLTWPPADVSQLPMQPSEVACYDPSLPSVADGVCTLSAVAKGQTTGGRSFEYATSVIATKESPFAPGCYVEFDACFPTSGSTLLNHTGLWATAADWPAHGECDVAESWDGSMTCNYHDPAGSPGANVAGDWSGWHTYGALYGVESASFYYDGVLVATLADDAETFPQYLLCSIQLGDSPAPVDVPCELQLRSVKVWSPA